MDWGVFHVEHGFVSHWQKYQQALKQRNAALKARQPREVTSVWDSELIRHGEVITDARARYVDLLLPQAQAVGYRLLGREISFSFRAGWLKGQPLEEALKNSWDADRERGSTLVGPQRAELHVRMNGVAAKDEVSRGQQKLLAAALLLAQLKLFGADSGARPILLLDDPAAELDGQRLGLLLEEVRAMPLQLFVTSLSERVDALGAPGLHVRFNQGELLSG
jgi:DNA replication and repair protein RecF